MTEGEESTEWIFPIIFGYVRTFCDSELKSWSRIEEREEVKKEGLKENKYGVH